MTKSIEQRISDAVEKDRGYSSAYLERHPQRFDYTTIDVLNGTQWCGCPETERGWENPVNPLYQVTDRLIAEADAVECLTSEVRYIRETKKWFLEQSAIYDCPKDKRK